MLPEILCALSGHRSEIWDRVRNGNVATNGIHDYVSEPEQAMLEVLGHISKLHIDIREMSTRLAADHKSVVCRAVCSSINQTHLAAFRKRVLEVEAALLSRDAEYVGGYGIVPLSTIVSDFRPWLRKLEWLSKTTVYVNGNNLSTVANPDVCTGTMLLDWLSYETRTGYADIETLATQLLSTGQQVWMSLAASWLLYGKLPAFGASDFFIQYDSKASSVLEQYSINRTQIPSFVTPPATETTLAIGTALIQIQAHEKDGRNHTMPVSHMNTVTKHLRVLESVTFPINTSSLESALSEIDETVSQNSLSQLLSLTEICRLLDVVHRFMLLGDGEFTISLIEHASSKIFERQLAQGSSKPVRKAGRMEGLDIKTPELKSILSRTWDEISALQTNTVPEDEVFDMAKRTIMLCKPSDDMNAPISTLLPTAAVLTMGFDPNSSWHLFLTKNNIDHYASLNAYLLSIRRSEMQLASLWKLTTQRRCHPTPLGPPMSATVFGQKALKTRRDRETARTKIMRQHWSTSSKALFVISQLNTYFHGEIIRQSWRTFIKWLTDSGQSGITSRDGSRPTTAWSTKWGHPGHGSNSTERRRDPRALSQGHNIFLQVLQQSLLIGNADWLTILKDMLTMIDHYVALFSRLQSVWEGLDLQEDDGIIDAFSNFAQDETELLTEMSRSRLRLEEMIAALVQNLKNVEKDRLVDDMLDTLHHVKLESASFVPWAPRTMDRLIMKLELLSGMKHVSDEDDIGTSEG